MTRPTALTMLLAALMLAAASPPPRPAPPAPAVFPYGVSWYPEQFPESEWAGELALMKRANITFVRIAEFSWSTLEPREGQYDFAWLDRAIARAAAHGLKVVIGTPTAAPPAWLTTKYPDVLAMEADGTPVRHGWRRHFSVASPRYRKLSAGIAGKLAERYGRDPAVIGFQIDNEYGRDTFDPVMRGRFEAWLKARYGTLAAYNREQSNAFWSLAYDDWSQIAIPGTRDQPGLWIDWLRFLGSIWREYQQNQIDAMRPYLAADKLITTNFVAKYDEFDFSDPAQALDVVGWDWYYDDADFDPADGAMQHDLYRGFLDRAPWVMETAAGEQVGAQTHYVQARGLTRAMAWQAIGHGADGYAFWVWRTPLNGAETGHGSLVDAGGRPRPIYDEIARTGGEVARAWTALRGTSPVADAAMIYDYPNRWAVERQPYAKGYDVWRAFVRFRAALTPVSTGVDVRRDADGLARYKLVVAPNLPLMSADTAAKLVAYVRGGGHLVLGPRAGRKNENSRVWAVSPMEALTGARVDIAEMPAAPVTLTGPLGQASTAIWAERATPEAKDVEVLFRYGKADGWLDGAPGVVSRAVGKGRVTYVGAWLDEPALGRVVAWAAAKAGTAPAMPDIPAMVELNTRAGGGRTVRVAINWGKSPATLPLPRSMRDLVTGGTVRSAKLDPYGVAVLEETR